MRALGEAGGVFAQVQTSSDEIGQCVSILGILLICVLQQLLGFLPVALLHRAGRRAIVQLCSEAVPLTQLLVYDRCLLHLGAPLKMTHLS